MRVLIDGACPYCRALGRTLKALDLGGTLQVVPLQEASGLDPKALLEELHVLEGTGPTGATPPSSPWPGGFPSSGPFTPFSSSSSPSGRASGSTASWRKGGPVPELPEVETTRRRLRPLVLGQTLRQVVHRDPARYRNTALAEGRRILEVDRRGKFLLFALEGGVELVAHLGMTGGSGWSRRPTPGRPWSSRAGPSTSTTPGASGASLGCGAGTTGRSPPPPPRPRAPLGGLRLSRVLPRAEGEREAP